MTALAFAAMAIVGCGKNAASVSEKNSKVFASADETTKTNWQSAATALKSGDYATAILTLQELLSQPTLTTEQQQAVADTLATANEQMTAAANKGDPKAKAAQEALRKSRTR